MNSIVLTDSEISIIKYFLEGVADIQLVEGVYLSTQRVDEQSVEGQVLNIIFFYNYAPYDPQYLGTLDLSTDQEKLHNLFNGVDLSKEDRLCTIELDSENLSLRMTNLAQVLSFSVLVNSTILFDRYGSIEKIKNKALSNEKLRANLVEDVPQIENIGCILGDGIGTK